MNNTVIELPDDLSPITSFFMQGLGNEVNLANDEEMGLLLRGIFFLYVTVAVLAILAYKFGFAKKLTPLKSMVIYILLLIGMFFLTILFWVSLPLAESLLIIALVMGIYRLRLHQERKKR
ncbi:YlaH-like protein [Gracilibacillus ureilyticus]|uniref:YlaH-like protein n=1 Tax=Gracilibacillus ureilyticus TaxID=531814 RepID=A0A1H9TJM5_9BACI|nr:YlaH-like family protein [Gracilibacillus ureilyticus]SER97316.1 YlaH-like protein [Gracilibacillus ureilyticus]